MSLLAPVEPADAHGAAGAVEIVVELSSKDLGGFRVRRALHEYLKGGWWDRLFFSTIWGRRGSRGEWRDRCAAASDMIGLATLTYLVDGSILSSRYAGECAENRAGRRKLDDGGAGDCAFGTLLGGIAEAGAADDRGAKLVGAA